MTWWRLATTYSTIYSAVFDDKKITCSARRSRRVLGGRALLNDNISETREQRRDRCADGGSIFYVRISTTAIGGFSEEDGKTKNRKSENESSNGAKQMGNSAGRVQHCGLWSSRRAFEHCCAPVAHSPKPLPSPERFHLRAPPFYFYHHVFQRSAHYLCEAPGTAAVFLFRYFPQKSLVDKQYIGTHRNSYDRYTMCERPRSSDFNFSKLFLS